MVRFMDWQRTNNAEMQRSSERALEKHTFWSTERRVPGVAVCIAKTLLVPFSW